MRSFGGNLLMVGGCHVKLAFFVETNGCEKYTYIWLFVVYENQAY